jgi:hypothetical protein
MTERVLVIDLKLLRRFSFVAYFTYGRLILTLVFVVTIIVIVFGTRCWGWRGAFELNLVHGVSWVSEAAPL